MSFNITFSLLVILVVVVFPMNKSSSYSRGVYIAKTTSQSKYVEWHLSRETTSWIFDLVTLWNHCTQVICIFHFFHDVWLTFAFAFDLVLSGSTTVRRLMTSRTTIIKVTFEFPFCQFWLLYINSNDCRALTRLLFDGFVIFLNLEKNHKIFELHFLSLMF